MKNVPQNASEQEKKSQEVLAEVSQDVPMSRPRKSMLLAIHDALEGGRQSRLVRNITLILSIGVLCSVLATYYVIAYSDNPLGPDPQKVLPLVLLDLALLLGLATIITWRLADLWLARRRGAVGSRMQMRMIQIFGLISVVPGVIVAVFSSLFFNFGIQSWFDERVGVALRESVAVAEGYLREHRENLRADVLVMANDLNRQAPVLSRNPARFKQVLMTQAALRSLAEAVAFQYNESLGLTGGGNSLLFELNAIPTDVMAQAATGEVVILTSNEEDRVRALVRLNNYLDTYLLIGRFVDSNVLEHMHLSKGSVHEYGALKANISRLQIQFSFVFIGVSLLLLLVALWIAMIFAGDIVEPIKRLVAATERVKAGNLDTRLNEGPRNDEMGTLDRAFNRMTDRLQKQHDELMDANKKMDERRRFIEAVLSGVTAGVIAIDSEKYITLFNRSAPELIGKQGREMEQQLLVDVIPELSELLEQAEGGDSVLYQGEITIVRNGKNATFNVRIVTEELGDEIEGYVVTLDDITTLQAAQRTAAWGDVARRIAHEIKNPLTPIHLATERLQRKFSDEIQSDKDAFERYLATITRHVGTIGQIVEEFANFARMPAPKLRREDVCAVIREAIFSEEVVNPEITYSLVAPDCPVYINADAGQLNQVLSNTMKNAKEALLNRVGGKEKEAGKICITVNQDGHKCHVILEDNGCGFPQDLIDRITEPYVTTRERGTGLGLAIVKKVVLDHDGSLELSNRFDEENIVIGARIEMTFPQVV